MKNFTLFSTLTILWLFSSPLGAANFTSTATGNWSMAATWALTSGTDADGIPDSDDNVSISSGRTITLDAAGISVNDLTLTGTLQGVQDFTILGNFIQTGGLLNNEGATTITGTFNWQGGTLGSTGTGTITLNGLLTMATATTFTLNNRTLVLNGGGAWSNGNLSMLGSSIFRLPATKILNITGTTPLSILASGAGTRLFDILGDCVKTNTNTLLIQVPVAFAGLLDVLAGTLDLAAGGTLSHTLNFAASTVLKISGGTLDVLQDIAMAGKVLFSAQTAKMILHFAESFGALEMLGGVLTLGGKLDVIGDCIIGNGTLTTLIDGIGNLEIAGKLVLKAAATIANVGNIVVQGAFEWLGGTVGAVAALGSFIVNGLTTIGHAACKLVNTVMVVTGGAELLSGAVTFFQDAIFRVPVGAILSQIANLPFEFLSGDGLNATLEILGTLSKTGTNVLKCAIKFTLNGTASIINGILRIEKGIVMGVNSALNLAANVAFELVGGVANLINVIGTSTIKVLGAIVNFLTPNNLVPPQSWVVTSGTVILYSLGGEVGEVLNVTISGGTIEGSGELKILGNLSMSGGRFARSGNTLVNGNLEWTGGGIGSSSLPLVSTVTISGTTNIAVYVSIEKTKLVLNGNGSLTNADFGLISGSTLEIGTGSTFTCNINGGYRFAPGGSDNKVDVKGTLVKEGNRNLNFDVALHNSGTIRITNGSISPRVGFNITGNIVCDVIQGFGFGNSGNPSFGNSFDGATMSGTGSMLVSGGVNITNGFNSTLGAIKFTNGGSINSSGVFNHSGNMDIELGGFIPLGTSTIGGNLTILLGSIGSATAPSVTDVTVGGLTTFNSSSDISIRGVKLILNGGGSWTAGRIYMDNGSILEIPATQTLVANKSGGAGLLLEPSGTVNLKGILRKQGTSGMTVKLSFVNTGEIFVEGGVLGMARLPPTSSYYSGNGSINVSTGATLKADFLDYPNHLLTNNGTISFLSGGDYTISLNGSTQQTIAGTGTIDHLKLNNTEGLVTTGVQTLSTNLIFTEGKIQLGASDFILSSTASMTGFGTTKYFQTNSTGNLKRTVGTTDVLFPVGESNYTPVTIRQTSGTDTYSVRVSDGIDIAHPLFGTQYIGKEWEISRTPSNVTATTVKLQWNSPTDEGAGFVLANAQMLHHNGTNWETLPTANRTTAVGSLTQTNVTNFSPFTVGLPSVVLAAELIDFQAIAKKDYNQITWQTVSEDHAAHFEIHSSLDGQVFEKIGQTKAKGIASFYQFDDPNDPLSNLLFYRLKMVDTNGKSQFSKVKSVARGKGLSVHVFPNPVRNELTIEINSENSKPKVEVFDLLGRAVFAKITEGGNLLKINTLDWQTGFYFLKITDGQKVFQQKILKQ